MAKKMIWAETQLLPGRPQLFTEAQFKIHRTNGWVEMDDPPDVDPDAKQPAETVIKRSPSDKKPASETMIERSLSDKQPAIETMTERPPSDKQPASLQAVAEEVPVETPPKSSVKKKKTSTKSSTTKK